MLRRLSLSLLLLLVPCSLFSVENPVEITLAPQGLVHGHFVLPVSTQPQVARVVVSINGVRYAEKSGRSMVFPIEVGEYIRRLRIRAVGFDAEGKEAGEDEIVLNDPQPPFRIRLVAPAEEPAEGMAEISASVTAPPNVPVQAVDFYLGETLIGSDATPPYNVAFDVGHFPRASYVRAVARGAGGLEANDVAFMGGHPSENVEVNIHHLPVSVMGESPHRLSGSDLTLIDNGTPRKIEEVISASDQPLNVIVLMDSSESMLEELPVVKEAAKRFARQLIRPQDRIAIVAFRERTIWLTPFTSDPAAVDRAVEKLRPMGETHLYDAVIEMLFQLQKMPGRKALVVLTDGMNQGGEFNLDHMVYYARSCGIPIYPIVKNRMLSRLMRFGLGFTMKAKQFANLARDTGATYFIIRSPSELGGVYARIAAELSQQYLVSFYTEDNGKDQWHPVRLDCRLPGVQLRYPRGYFP
ncbi:MAG: VWA domain-containing protein [Thermoanaerobaculia bacterium]